MTKQLQTKTHYRIRDPNNFYTEMHRDVSLLMDKQAYVSLTTVIVCGLDALAAGDGSANRNKFEQFVMRHFPDLCKKLTKTCPGKVGAKLLYDKFRNGFAHLRGPKSGFAIAQDNELGGRWAERVKIGDSEPLVALNVDRFAREFLRLLNQLNENAITKKIKKS